MERNSLCVLEALNSTIWGLHPCPHPHLDCKGWNMIQKLQLASQVTQIVHQTPGPHQLQGSMPVLPTALPNSNHKSCRPATSARQGWPQGLPMVLVHSSFSSSWPAKDTWHMHSKLQSGQSSIQFIETKRNNQNKEIKRYVPMKEQDTTLEEKAKNT